jgi:hypothetical protein
MGGGKKEWKRELNQEANLFGFIFHLGSERVRAVSA